MVKHCCIGIIDGAREGYMPELERDNRLQIWQDFSYSSPGWDVLANRRACTVCFLRWSQECTFFGSKQLGTCFWLQMVHRFWLQMVQVHLFLVILRSSKAFPFLTIALYSLRGLIACTVVCFTWSQSIPVFGSNRYGYTCFWLQTVRVHLFLAANGTRTHFLGLLTLLPVSLPSSEIIRSFLPQDFSDRGQLSLDCRNETVVGGNRHLFAWPITEQQQPGMVWGGGPIGIGAKGGGWGWCSFVACLN